MKLTYEDYCALPNDGRRYQIVEGDVSATPAPASSHQRISANLEMIIRQHVKKNRLGAVYDAPIDVILDDHNILQPDILFVRKDRLGIVNERGVEAGPDLVVEILSPSTRRLDRTDKMRIYARHGVAEYWLVDPQARTLEVFALVEGVYLLRAALTEPEVHRSDLLGGLEIPLSEVFAPDL